MENRNYYQVLRFSDATRIRPTKCRIYAKNEDDALNQLSSFLTAIGYKFPAVKSHKAGKTLVVLSERKRAADGADWSFDQFMVRC